PFASAPCECSQARAPRSLLVQGKASLSPWLGSRASIWKPSPPWPDSINRMEGPAGAWPVLVTVAPWADRSATTRFGRGHVNGPPRRTLLFSSTSCTSFLASAVATSRVSWHAKVAESVSSGGSALIDSVTSSTVSLDGPAGPWPCFDTDTLPPA